MQVNSYRRLKALSLGIFHNYILLIAVILSFSCGYDCDKVTYTPYVRHLVDVDSLRDAIQVVGSKEISIPGGLYYEDGFVYINERGKGYMFWTTHLWPTLSQLPS